MSSSTGWRLKNTRGTPSASALSAMTAAAVRSTRLTHSTSQPRARKRSTWSIWVFWLLLPSAMKRVIFSPVPLSASRTRPSKSWAMAEIKVSSWV